MNTKYRKWTDGKLGMLRSKIKFKGKKDVSIMTEHQNHYTEFVTSSFG